MNETYVIEGVLFTRSCAENRKLYYTITSTFHEDLGTIMCNGDNQYYFVPVTPSIIDRELSAILTMINKLHDFYQSNYEFLRSLNTYKNDFNIMY